MRVSSLVTVVIALVALLFSGAAYAGSAPAGPDCVVGVYSTADEFFLDVDGNGIWDGATTDTRFKLATGLGVGTALVGDFNGDASEGVGKYVASTGFFALDLNENNTWDGNGGGDRARAFVGSIANGPGFVGKWGSQTTDGPGRYLNSAFFVDDNGNGVWDGAGTDGRFPFIPSLVIATTQIVVGDWNGDGETDVAKYDQNTGRIFVDANGNRAWNGTAGGDINSAFGAAFAGANGGGVIVVGDWDGDGDDNIALYVDGADTFLVDTNGNFLWDGAGGGDSLVALGQGLMSGNTASSCDFDGTAGDELNKFNAGAAANASDLNGNLATDGGEVRAFIPALIGSIGAGITVEP